MPRARLCCGNCFGDRFLHKHISIVGRRIGKCSYCDTSKTSLVKPSDLADKFGQLLNIYQSDKGGKFLVDWLKEDWELFHHPKFDSAKSKELLADVLNDGDVVRQLFVPSSRYPSDRLNKWEKLREELMYKNRYFPTKLLDEDRLEELLSHLIADVLPTKWYRARLQTGEAPFEISEMGPPPRRQASHEGQILPEFLTFISAQRPTLQRLRCDHIQEKLHALQTSGCPRTLKSLICVVRVDSCLPSCLLSKTTLDCCGATLVFWNV